MKAIWELLGLGGRIVEARVKLKEAQIVAEADAVARVVDQKGAWETLAAQNAANSWLDEWWTVILSIPLMLAFVPKLAVYVERGFIAIETVPEWYQWAVLASVSFAFARKTIPKLSWARRK